MLRWVLVFVAAVTIGFGAHALAQSSDQLRRQYLDAYHALEVKDDEAVLVVLNKDFPVNYQDADGYTLLHIAASNNRLDMVKELLKRGADPAAKSRMGFTPVDSGITIPKIVDLLVEAGGPRPAGYKSATTRPAAPAPAKKPTAATAPAKKPAAAATPTKPASKYEKQCQEKWYADQALCSDSTCMMRAYRKWDTCLKTGSYY